MRISDWSSDVCSSDLAAEAGPKHRLVEHEARSSQCLQPAPGFGGKGRPRGVRRAGDPEDAVFRVRMILPAPGLGEAVHPAGGDGRVADLVDPDDAAAQPAPPIGKGRNRAIEAAGAMANVVEAPRPAVALPPY